MRKHKTEDGGRQKRRRFLPMVWLSGAGAAALLILGVSGSLSAFTASITNSANSVATGTLIMTETGPGSTGLSTTCASSQDTTGNNAYTCSTINKYGANGVNDSTMGPGDSISTTVTIADTGSVNANTFTAAFGACSQTPTVGTLNPVLAAGNLCSELNLVVYPNASPTGTPIFTGTLTAANAGGTITLTAPNATTAGGTGQAYTFVVSMPSTANNTYESIVATQAITWSFSH